MFVSSYQNKWIVLEEFDYVIQTCIILCNGLTPLTWMFKYLSKAFDIIEKLKVWKIWNDWLAVLD